MAITRPRQPEQQAVQRVTAYQPKVRPLQMNPDVMVRSVDDYLVMVYGPPGIGKTTFINELYLGEVLFISTDRGTRTIKTNREEAHSYEDFQDVLHTLTQQRSKYNYRCVCIDHVDDMSDVFEAHVCTQLKIDSLTDAGFGKGYKLFRQEIQKYTQGLLRLGYAVAYVAHEEVKLVKTRSIELNRTMPSMSKSSARVIIPMVDLMGYCGFKTLKLPEGGHEEVRTIDTRPREDQQAKDRTVRNKPATFEYLDGTSFRETFNTTGDATHGQSATNATRSSSGNGRPATQPSRTASPGPGRRAIPAASTSPPSNHRNQDHLRRPAPTTAGRRAVPARR